jgi:signal transduction histidine kinase
MGRRLAELDALKDSFLAMITHDLRHPLTTILGWSSILAEQLDGKVDQTQLTGLRQIEKSARDLDGLVGDILDLAKLEAGRMEFKPEPVALARAAADVRAQVQLQAQARGVEVDVSGLPSDATLAFDPQALRRLLTNLVSNSLKFTPKGGAVRLLYDRTQAGEHRVTVRDNGAGIPEGQLEAVFEKFVQVGGGRSAGGTGLGLAICRQLVEGHGGRIWAESAPGKGAAFIFTVPARRL